ncbi:hypothetical protein [Pacificoceanicola onchidii]|uniref:hypothetical protein n=1 Tax=Pacificoceanicola onchidii TaxID=2562685 RepID=UPI0010A5337E|nr:hypothetical protein [Pacificoceanicola onchidii]
MKQYSLAFAIVTIVAVPSSAQEDDGSSLMEEGMKLFMRGLMTEMEPALKELEGLAEEARPFFNDFVQEMGPALSELMEKVEDWSAYHPPEMLPNGDIILRKKTPEEREKDDDGVEIEL